MRGRDSVTVGAPPGLLTVALALALVPGLFIAVAICAAAGIRDLDNAGFAVYLGSVTVVTIVLLLGCRVRFAGDGILVRRFWWPRRVAWPDVAHAEFYDERAAIGEDSAQEWLAVRLTDGRRVGLLPIFGGLRSDVTARTRVGRRTERLMATALTQLHEHGVPGEGGVDLAELPAVRRLWARGSVG
jgi:hypothetical protein